ncbi:Nidogen-2 [Aphelenchoides fujianensis]|nr:Nidogen-2 [Aphelenchoides fujianensis]
MKETFCVHFNLSIFLLFLRIPVGRAVDERCTDPFDAGPCHFFQRRFYFDQSKQKCLPFNYGGCLGTKNRFSTQQKCMSACVYRMNEPTTIPEICLLDKEPGHCKDDRSLQWWYFFNADTGICEQFQYAGCNGNDNRFYSLYQCRQVCGERLEPDIACHRCDTRTSTCKAIDKYHYVCVCREGYLKDDRGECVDADECELLQAECDEQATCVNTVGSYSCKCADDYVGDGKTCTFVGIASSVDDCGECDEHAVCTHGRCQCKLGFTGDGFNCTDVDECVEKEWPCDKNAQCVNTEGGFYCECSPRHAGNGFTCTTDKTACLDKFDREYEQACAGGRWHEHFYVDHTSKQCRMIWTHGCRAKSDSRNLFSDLTTCEDMCIRNDFVGKSPVCWDKFDPRLRQQCSRGEWQQRYFFDHDSLTCQLFWFDGCQSSSKNVFDDLLTCQWLCSEQTRYKTRACLEEFDEHYRDECNGGMWRQNYYFDKQKKRCVPFWYDGCTGSSANLFPDLQSCMQTCETSVGEAASDSIRQKIPFGGQHSARQSTARPPVTHAHRHHLQRPQHPQSPAVTLRPMDRPGAKIYGAKSEEERTTLRPTTPKEVENVCERADPCQNNGTCVYDKLKKTYHCECVDGYTSRNCTLLDDRDPCSKSPCKNGATCTNKPDKEKKGLTFDCFCAFGFAGPHCEEQPCEPNPLQKQRDLQNDKGAPLYFCECTPEWGGKMCAIPIPNVSTRKYGKNVQLLSSGKAEWIEDLKRHKQRDRNRSGGGGTGGFDPSGNFTEPDDGLMNVANGSDAHTKLFQSRTLRLPAGSTEDRLLASSTSLL